MIIKLAFAFGAGFVSFLTPCVLPIIPGYISYITGKNLDEIEQDRRNVLIKTILFSIGFSLVFIVLGATASAVGNILLFLSNELRIAAGISPWGKVKPEVCFKKGIGQIKDPDIVRHLTLLIESGSKLYTMCSNEEKDLQTINKNELVKLEKNASIELRF